MTRIYNPARYGAVMLQNRGPKPAPTDLSGVKITVCPPAVAKNAPRLMGVTGTSRTGRGGRKGSSAP